jgi:hypothetical protein
MPSEAVKAEIRAATAARKAAGKTGRHRALPPVESLRPCAHRGDPTGESEACGSCRGRVTLKVFSCAVYATGCTIARKVDGRACCVGCPDYAPRQIAQERAGSTTAPPG